tara:strand:- start:1059 stop:1355 length:297 start_codon:yes stop_codon:yes gene_type:complete
VWVFTDGALADEPLYYGFDRVMEKLLIKEGAMKNRKALSAGCNLILSEREMPNTYKMILEFKENTGARYTNDEIGSGWLECEHLIGCPTVLYVGVDVV